MELKFNKEVCGLFIFILIFSFVFIPSGFSSDEMSATESLEIIAERMNSLSGSLSNMPTTPRMSGTLEIKRDDEEDDS